MKKTVTFGETMARLCAPDGIRIGQSDRLELTFGGAESNVAVSLVNFGVPASFVTKLPDNPLTDAFIAQLRSFGVETSSIVRGGERMGVYYVEKAIAPRAGKVVYDRKHSAISEIGEGEIDWDKAFEGADRFHWTGITPALSPAAARETLTALKAARRHDLFVSCDLNYRAALWTPEEARAALEPMMEYVDLCIANESEPGLVFGIAADQSEYRNGVLSPAGYAGMAEQLCSRYGIAKCGFAIRESNESGAYIWSGLVYNGTDCFTSKKYPVQVLDRIGGGDAFGAGLIAAYALGMDDARAVRFAAAASALKHTFAGDMNRTTRAEAEALM